MGLTQNDIRAVQTADNVYITIDSGTGSNYYEGALIFQHGSVTRWAIEKDNVADADLYIRRYNSSGVLQDSPISLDGANGAVTFVQPLKFTGILSSAASASGIIMGTGTTANPATTATADAKFLEFRCQTTATSGDNRLMYLRYDIAGTTGGECIRAFTKGSAALTTARGAHISLDMAAAGTISGLGAGIDAQVMLAASTTYSTGTWGVINAEIYTGGTTVISATAFSYLRIVNSGSSQSTVDDNCFLFELAGFTSGATKLWYDNQGSAPANVEEWIKVKTPSGTRWLALYNAVV
jgi:hypothetical protein